VAGEKRTMLFEVVGDILIAVHTADPPTDAEWAEFMAAARPIVARPAMANLVFTEGGGPNLLQRRAATETLQGRHVPVAVVTANAFVRFIAAALAAFNSKVRLFAPDQVEEALLHVGAGPRERKALLRSADKLRAQLRAGAR
jgi:hypothetical protein